MKIKKFALVMMIIYFISSININAYAAPDGQYKPTANVYGEGIYHFQSGMGNKIIFKLSDPSKPVNILIIEGNDLMYYIQLNEKLTKSELDLNKPLDEHTTIIVGEGEISYTFQ